MPGPRVCVVSFRDVEGMEHAVEVAAGSLYEAAALGLKAFRSSSFGGGFGPGVTAVLTVSVKREEGRHQVLVRQVENWLHSNGKSPREQALKQRLRGMLGRGAR